MEGLRLQHRENSRRMERGRGKGRGREGERENGYALSGRHSFMGNLDVLKRGVLVVKE